MEALHHPTRAPAPAIVLIDDQPIVREALAHAICRLDVEARVLEADSLAAGRSLLAATPEVALAILDLASGGAEGPASLTRLLAVHPHLRVLVLSARDDPGSARAALAAGARGFVSKRSPTALLMDVIRLVLVGGMYVPPEAVGAGFGPNGRLADRDGGSIQRAANAERVQLTPRQQAVLALMLKGRPNKLICRSLNLREGTVKTHIAAIFRALNVSNRTAAAYAASRLGLALPDVDEPGAAAAREVRSRPAATPPPRSGAGPFRAAAFGLAIAME